MENNVKEVVKGILDSHLETHKLRKTLERYTILDAAYSIEKRFTVTQLGEYLDEHNFHVSRATLFNTMRLLLELRLIARHSLMNGIVYEACYNKSNQCLQICTACGKVTEVHGPHTKDVLENIHLHRFREDRFVTYIYGICSTCLAKQTRMKKKNIKNKLNNDK
jgi:Fur family transcriptional regulator, ferric uptake regulator